jgi:phage host-nuclease inhibitor protein Gam
MGKYDKVNKRLDKYQEPKSQQDRLDDEKLRLAKEYNLHNPKASDLVALYVNARKNKDALEEELKAVNMEVEALTQMVIAAYEVEGVDSMRMPDLGFSVWQQDEPYVSTTDRDALLDWVKTEGLERSLQLPWQTLNAITKERLLNGEPEPPGTKTWLRQKLVMRKA